MSATGSKAKGLLWVACAVALAGGAAFALPHLARHVPWSVEQWLGGVFGDGAPGKACKGRKRPESAAAFEKLVRRIYPLSAEDRTLPISVEVIAGDTVNAFATLGGHVYVFEGLIRQAESPEELAGVLAHEIEHVRDRHIIQGLAVSLVTFQALQTAMPAGDPFDGRIALLLLGLQFSRQQEAQADAGALERLRLAQVDAKGFEQFFARAEKSPSAPPILSNHPSNETRRAMAARVGDYPTRPVLDLDEWQALGAICK